MMDVHLWDCSGSIPNGIQKLRALMSNLESSVVIAEGGRFSPVSGMRGGSVTTSLQTCDSIAATVSRNELCLRDTKPPRLHIKQ